MNKTRKISFATGFALASAWFGTHCGSVFASYLKRGGADMTLVDMYKEHMDKVAAEGMTFDIFPDERYQLTGFKAGNCHAYLRDEIVPFIWKKVIINSTMNTVCAVLRMNIGTVEADPYGRELFHRVIREACAVATAKGCPLEAEEFIREDHNPVAVSCATYYPSMCQDVFMNKRQTEISVLNGKISEYGKQLGILTPTNDLLTLIISAIQGNYDKQYQEKKA